MATQDLLNKKASRMAWRVSCLINSAICRKLEPVPRGTALRPAFDEAKTGLKFKRLFDLIAVNSRLTAI
jgi:hypothetical protein